VCLPIDCRVRSPVNFLELLENPELRVLNIKFPAHVTSTEFHEIVSAANTNCRLGHLNGLALAGGGWFTHCCGARPEPRIQPADLRATFKMLLPMTRLKTLRLSVAPNFLDVLDLDIYKTMTAGLPSLEKLYLGHAEFIASSQYHPTVFYERVPLHHLAAFCHLLPNLIEVSLGTADGFALEETPRSEWECAGVQTLSISHWIGERLSHDVLHLGLRTYFPNSELAMKGLSPRMYIFEV
jgi:hypothetical protein